ncbi:MAG: hypothetical protein RJA76_620 [Bacteroidota bacterium]|jgi:xanthine/CO dehydrogenase XdhC/CoxF family maturation factor
MKEWVEIVEKLNEALQQDTPLALATVIQVEGSAYRRTGARMLILENGNWVGSISGGCLEGDMLKKARLAIESQKIKVVTYDTRDEDPFALGIGLGCNGKIDILIDPNRDRIIQFKELMEFALGSEDGLIIRNFWNFLEDNESLISIVEEKHLSNNLQWENDQITLIEYIPPQPRIWIFGNQFDSHSLIKICHQLGWKIHWIGNVLKMKDSIKNLCKACYDWEDVKEIQKGDYVVCMTHDLERDISICKELYNQDQIAYWGILGPSKRLQKIKDNLGGGSIQLPTTIHSPIGLDLGAEGPDEIAIAIVAEILAFKNQRDAQSLRNRIKPIHES